MENYRKSQIDNAESLDMLLREQYEGVPPQGHEEEEGGVQEEAGQYNARAHYAELNRVIEDLIDLAKDIVESDKNGQDIGLTKEEASFYNALTFKDGIEDYYKDEILIEMAKELTRELQKNESIDWQYKESGRARMRTIVRRLLRKYDYPPEDRMEALEIVLKQCEHWTERRMVYNA